MTLAVRRMPSPHIADHVRELVDAILEEWDIPTSKVKVVITDNGSNMVAAFRTYLAAPSEIVNSNIKLLYLQGLEAQAKPHKTQVQST